MQRICTSGLLPALLLCSAALAQTGASTDTQPETAPSARPSSKISIETQPLSAIGTRATYQALAEVTAPNVSPLAVEVGGLVAEIPVDVADMVRAGDLLLRLDDLDLQLELEQAQAQLAAAGARVKQAEQRLQRARRLSDSEFISADDLLDRQTDLLIQQAEYSRLTVASRLAARRLEKTRVLAPFDATITERNAQIGQLLSPGQQVMVLVDLAPPHVIAGVPANDRHSLSAAENFQLLTQRGRYPLTLLNAAPAVDAVSRVSPARLGFVGQAELPGTTGTVIWEVPGALIPVELIIRRNGELGVFVMNDDCAEFVPLPAAEEGRPAAHNLAPDARIVTRGQQRLTGCAETP